MDDVLVSDPSSQECRFFAKLGACVHGDACTRKHTPAATGRTVVISNIYTPLDGSATAALRNEDLQDFIEDLRGELERYGAIRSVDFAVETQPPWLHSTYIGYESAEAARSAASALSGRFYAGRVVQASLLDVDDVREDCGCKQFALGECNRGPNCAFVHFARF